MVQKKNAQPRQFERKLIAMSNDVQRAKCKFMAIKREL